MLTGSSSGIHDRIEFRTGFLMLGLYIIAHALMSLWIHRTWMPTRSPMWPRLFFLVSIGIPYCATFVIYYLFTQDFLEDTTIPGIMLNSLYAIADGDEKSVWAHLIAALVLTVGALALNAKWIFRRLKDFKPYERPTTPVAPTASVTVTPSATHEGPTPPKLD